MADGARRIIERIRSLPRFTPLYVPDELPIDDVFAAMKEDSKGMFIRWEDVVTAIVPSIGDVSVTDHREQGKFMVQAQIASLVKIDYTATIQDLNAILVMLNKKVLANFEQQRDNFFKNMKGERQ